MAVAGMSARGACAILLVTLSFAITAEVTPDRVAIVHARDRLLVDVSRVKGIGGARLNMSEGEWPAAVIVRLHGFPELESFTAASKTARLDCALVRPEGQHPVQTCHVGDDSVYALERELDYFEVRLPREIFPSDDEAMEIRWVDQWR
jgi:hypothetical protein